MTTRRIEIIGGGLAGLSLGIALRRANIPVTLHEAGDYPRHRVCGEFITGLASSTIERLGLQAALAGALHHQEVAWSLGGRPPQIQQLPSAALGLSRHVLDARLAAILTEAGGELKTRSRITDITTEPGRVFSTGRRPSKDSAWLGLKAHVQGLTLTRDLEMHLGDHCYVGLARIEPNVVNVCGLFRRRSLRGQGVALLFEYLRASGLGLLAERLERAAPRVESFCAVAALGFDRRLIPRHRISLGDASAMIPPFTGNGMAMAFQSAEIALEPLVNFARHRTEWTETCGVINAALRRRFRLRLASAGALHPFLLRPSRQRWFAALGRSRLLPFGPLYATMH
jgi:flavin-dependent dehydrogenase